MTVHKKFQIQFYKVRALWALSSSFCWGHWLGALAPVLYSTVHCTVLLVLVFKSTNTKSIPRHFSPRNMGARSKFHKILKHFIMHFLRKDTFTRPLPKKCQHFKAQNDCRCHPFSEIVSYVACISWWLSNWQLKSP